jgi:predicted DNA-binding transcriptional regulator AlpA
MQDQDESRFEVSARTPPPDRLTWSITEVAQVLGISRASAYEAAHRGELRCASSAVGCSFPASPCCAC